MHIGMSEKQPLSSVAKGPRVRYSATYPTATIISSGWLTIHVEKIDVRFYDRLTLSS